MRENRTPVHKRVQPNCFGFIIIEAAISARAVHRISTCQSLLLRTPRKEFLEDLVTGNESWIHCDSNAHCAVRLPRGGEPPTQAKSNMHLKKVPLCRFWDLEGMLFYEYLPQGHSITTVVFTPFSSRNSRKLIGESSPEDRQCTSFM
ncbi:unnamed protein product [Heligmosomoides polygyrus]|uniref:Cyclic nucleotide-binding domain-containing protein n=1 Tax=Heligmosomoides polygyrus TaxID=6339 RepID=A0A3P8CP39_HELPZ|nr:unnamed protein product [Heligmosomoides polygyrus]